MTFEHPNSLQCLELLLNEARRRKPGASLALEVPNRPPNFYAVMIAIQNRGHDTMRLLFRRGAKYHPTDGDGQGVLHYAALVGIQKTMKCLVEQDMCCISTQITRRVWTHSSTILRYRSWKNWVTEEGNTSRISRAISPSLFTIRLGGSLLLNANGRGSREICYFG